MGKNFKGDKGHNLFCLICPFLNRKIHFIFITFWWGFKPQQHIFQKEG
jgi:hypothetical protein